MKILPPCGKACPRRKANCHNGDYCPAWGEYEVAKAADDAARKAERKHEVDLVMYHSRIARKCEKRGK